MDDEQQQRSRWGAPDCVTKQNYLLGVLYSTAYFFLIQRAFNSWSVGVVPFTLHAQHTFLSLASPHWMNDDERCWFKLLSLKNLCMVPN